VEDVKVKVSVCMTVFNQEKYVGEAIEGVLYQTTGFPFELVIGEDDSTDRSLAVCQEYQQRHPSVIRLHHRDCNLGCGRNQAQTWKECQGEYIAMLDGDDLWCSPLKLLQQATFLDRHPEYSMCFTRCGLLSDEPNRHDRWPYRINCKQTLTTSDILRHNLIANCSVMYRRAFLEYPAWISELPYCDIALHSSHSLGGPIGYIPQEMAIYRLHKGSHFEAMPFFDRVEYSIELYAALANNLPQPYSAEAMQMLLMMRLGLGAKKFKDIIATLRTLPLKYQATFPLIPLEQLYHLWVIKKPEKQKGGRYETAVDWRRRIRGASSSGGGAEAD
jgi:glycosyltransferase involved in cell wall biosynthesis